MYIKALVCVLNTQSLHQPLLATHSQHLANRWVCVANRCINILAQQVLVTSTARSLAIQSQPHQNTSIRNGQLAHLHRSRNARKTLLLDLMADVLKEN